MRAKWHLSQRNERACWAATDSVDVGRFPCWRVGRAGRRPRYPLRVESRMAPSQPGAVARPRHAATRSGFGLGAAASHVGIELLEGAVSPSFAEPLADRMPDLEEVRFRALLTRIARFICNSARTCAGLPTQSWP